LGFTGVEGMAEFTVIKDDNGKIKYIETALTGNQLLENYALNKGTAFTQAERESFELLGKLPLRIETLEEQVKRVYQQFKKIPSALAKNIYLNELHDQNETLFYKLTDDHINEMLPIVYTPTIGDAVENFSLEFRHPRGLFISYSDQEHIEKILDAYSSDNIDVIVVTDGEGVLGIGDQGVGGIHISIGKLAVYTLCAGINPNRVLPIQLDVGTNNEALLNDPMYLGWKHERIVGEDYDNFIGAFVSAVQKKFPNIYLHWEDFGRDTARKNLDRYRNKMCTFNDDMQGTGAVVLSALLSASKLLKQDLTEQRIVFLGAGTSATGIADQIRDAMIRQGLSDDAARDRIYLLGRRGLITDELSDVTSFQKIYAKKQNEISAWEVKDGALDLLTVIKNVKPTILIGCSTVGGAFTEEIVKTMAEHVEHPIIFPLSNPTKKAEAIPADILSWTKGNALIATGSPFDPVEFGSKKIQISQCNNSFVFPGIGLGVIAVKAKQVTDGMIWAGCQALTECVLVEQDFSSPLLPDLDNIKEVSMKVATAVAKQAIAEGVADDVDIKKAIESTIWEPRYYPYNSQDVGCRSSQ
jgi:malate dehydrogenase (oxaloacetate-decarboxylating)